MLSLMLLLAACAGQEPIKVDSNALQAPIRVDVSLINVTFSVRDASGTPVANLSQDDFEILEDGVPQKTAFFARRNDLPLTLGLIVDVSGSQDHFDKQHHRDLQAFLTQTLEPRDRAFLVCFGNHLRVASDYSADPGHLVQALEAFHKKGGGKLPELGPKEVRDMGTAFYDSIYYSITERLATTPGQGRRALLMFSDGEDNSSSHNMLEAIEMAQASDVLFFGLRYTELSKGRLTARNKYGTSVMDRIAQMTGGAHFDAKQGLAKPFAEIAEQLRSSYEIAYHSTNVEKDSGFRKIRIRVKQPGLTVRAKTGYYAN